MNRQGSRIEDVSSGRGGLAYEASVGCPQHSPMPIKRNRKRKQDLNDKTDVELRRSKRQRKTTAHDDYWYPVAANSSSGRSEVKTSSK